MSKVRDYESMALEEITDAKVALKRAINELRDEMQRAEQVFRRKHGLALAEQALKNAGVTGVSITPDPAALGTDMGGDE